MQRMRYAYLIVGLLIGTVLGSRSSEAQYTNNFQTNTISGVTSNWAGDYIVGNTNFADVLLIQNSGVLSNGNGYVGNTAAASNNSVVVSGSGSVWSNASDLYVGWNGSGNSLVISNNSSVESGNDGYIGEAASSSNNSVVVSDGATWHIAEDLYVGYNGSGNSLAITNGGGVEADDYGTIGTTGSSSNNSVLVSGSRSWWYIEGNLYVGYFGSGNSLVISNAGTVSSSNLVVGYNPSSSNNFIMLNGGDLTVTNPAQSGVLDVRRGMFTMNSSNTSVRVDTLLLTNGVSSIVTFNGGTLLTKSTTVSNGTVFTVGNGSSSATLNLQGGTHTFFNGLNISSNATLSGVGTVLGATTVYPGGTLAPGNGVGTLSISNSLVVSNAALQYELGTSSDLTMVSSNLTLGGSLNITDAGGFTNGTYTLFSYGGALTTNGTAGILTIGTTPYTNWVYTVDISSNHYVRLAVEPPPPVAGFSGSPTNGVAPLPVTFTNTSSGWITNGLWNFGDSNTTNTMAISLNHTYTTGGIYTVSLAVSGPGGTNTSTLTNYIVALTPAHLVVSPSSRNYGIVTVGQSSNQTFSVMNTGQQTLTGSASVGSPFAIVSGSPYSVPGNGTDTVTVSFGSVTGGVFSGAVIFASNGGNSTNTVAGIANAPPNVEAGSSQVVTLPTCALLNGSATDDGLPSGLLTTSWSTLSGPGSVTFGNANVTDTTACFSTNGTYVLRLTASDGVSIVSDDVTMIANAAPQIVTPLAVTNGLAQVGSLPVVAGGEPTCFTIGAYDPDNNSLSYLWDFGSGATNDPCHIFTNCGPHEVSVVVSDPFASTNATSPVAVACELTITKIQVKLNFAKTNSDSCSLTATLDLGSGYNLTNKVVTLDIGGAQVPFTLDAKGKGKGVSSFGSCKLTYKKKTGLWTLTANLRKGSWQTWWADYSMINSNIPKPGVSITNFLVISVLDTNAFAGTRNLLYTAKHGKSGTAK